MIGAFKNSRCIAWLGGIVLGVAAARGIWLILGQTDGTQGNRLLLAAVAAFVGVNIAIYIARMVAVREYQTRLLYLYEELDPGKMIAAVQPLTEKRMDASSRCTMLVHLANAHLYAGQTEQALALLATVQPPEKALAMRGLVIGNRATCYVWQNEMEQANAEMDALRALIANPACKKEFAAKARHTIGYLQLCKDIRQKKRVDLEALCKDCETSRAPLHRLDAQYHLALAHKAQGNMSTFAQAQQFVAQHGQHTALPQQLDAFSSNSK